jgi:steroid delta-isomerase-like uncharacterized protein
MAPKKTEVRAAALAYFEAMNARDVEGAVACWAQGAEDVLHGQRVMVAPDGVRSFVEEVLGAIPDFRLDVQDCTTDGNRCAVRYVVRGTFAGPGTWNGLEPTGAELEIPGVDVFVVGESGLIERNDAYMDSMTVGRQIGALPPQDSPAEQRLLSLTNARTKLGAKVLGLDFGQVAEGVWRIQGGPAKCNVYFVADGDGVLMFDAGARVMTDAVRAAAARLGGLTRIVLGHGHTDHRGTAPAFDVPVFCHPDEVEDAEGSGGFRYWGSLDALGWRKPIHQWLHRRFWDGGPVKIAGTVSEGDDVAGFRVVHIPGHAPGLIALYRESDRLALTSDLFYTIDEWGRDCDPHLPMPVYNWDTELARESIRKLAALEPQACWPGHAKAVAGTDVRAKLEAAANG